MSISFNEEFSPNYGHAVLLQNNVRRLTAHNPSPFTFTGTNSYILGNDELAIMTPVPMMKNNWQPCFGSLMVALSITFLLPIAIVIIAG